MEHPIQVQFSDEVTLERHKAFFRAQVLDEVPNSTGMSPRPGEKWKVVAEWDASQPGKPNGENRENRQVNPPSLVAWSPKGDFLYTSCDAFGLTAWDMRRFDWDIKNMHPYQPRKLGSDTHPNNYGYPVRFFIAQRGSSPEHICILQDTYTGLNPYYYIHDGEGRRICYGVAPSGSLWGWGHSHQFSDGKLNRNDGLDPWRPGSNCELAIVYDFCSLKLVDVTRLPNQPISSALLPKLLGKQVEIPEKKPVHEAPSLLWLSFDNLGVRDKTIFGFHFHPSGEYVAVTTGDWDDENWRRIHIVHLSSGSIVASIPAMAESLGWSPGGKYLLCKRKIESDINARTMITVWDSTQFVENMEPSDELLLQSWAMKAILSWTMKGILSNKDLLFSADGKRLLSRDGTVIASAIREDANIKAAEDIAKIADNKFSHAAWHPTDPHCFVTVGGAPSKDFPDTYQVHGNDLHGRLLRIWRLMD